MERNEHCDLQAHCRIVVSTLPPTLADRDMRPPLLLVLFLVLNVLSSATALSLASLTSSAGLRSRFRAAMAAASSAQEPAASASSPLSLLVQTSTGWVQGFSGGDGSDRWSGVPYAANPTGPLRWAKPQPRPSWSGVFDATKPGPVCLQNKNDGSTWGQEDCLMLNIFAPSNRTAGQKLPVWFWVHGGGWTQGTGMSIAGQFLAVQQNLIIVAINYRLGPYGFWSLPGFAAENADGTAGNWGLLDQLSALEWVQENIAAFGGDPAQVTIGGESAGGMSVCALLASPKAKGLFRAAIIESGGCHSPARFMPPVNAMAWGQTAATMVRCNSTKPAQTVACLRAMDAQTLSLSLGAGAMINSLISLFDAGVPVYPAPFFPAWSWTAVTDGAFLTDTPGAMMAAGEFNRPVRVLAGSNLMEMGNLAGVIHTMVPYTSFPFLDADLTKVTQHFFGPDPLVAAAIAARYPGRDFPTAEARFEAFFRDYLFKCTTLNALQSMAAHTSGDGSSAYFHYEFRYIGQPNQSSLPVHADELEFVWGVPTHRSPADLAMGANMGALWASFIRSGDPAAGNDGLQPRWQQYDAATQKDLFTLVLDQPLSSTTSSYTEAQCDMWAKFPGWLPPMPAELETVGGAAALTSRAAERIALA